MNNENKAALGGENIDQRGLLNVDRFMDIYTCNVLKMVKSQASHELF